MTPYDRAWWCYYLVCQRLLKEPTVSVWAANKPHARKFIDWAMREKDHCKKELKMTTGLNNGWNLNPKTMVAVFALVFAMGGFVYLQDWRVVALEVTVKEFKQDQKTLSDRTIKMETHMSYVRSDIKDIKEALQSIVAREKASQNNINPVRNN